MGILQKVVVGYDDYEDIILANVATNKNIIIIGKHGTGKTTIAQIVGAGYSEKATVQYYDCSKANMVTVCGIPNTEEMKEGRFSFVPHASTIWDKDIVILDELSRANKENQSMWMEFLEYGTVYGIPVNHKCIIATCNPQTYAASYKMDEAIWDRFDAVVVAPDFQNLCFDEIEGMLKLNIGESLDREEARKELSSLFDTINKYYMEYKRDRKITEAITRYLSRFVEVFQAQERKTYCSVRTFARQLPEQILILAAYRKAIESVEGDWFEEAAEKALIGTIVNKLKLDVNKILSIHENLKSLLQRMDLSLGEQYKIEYSKCVTLKDKCAFWDKRAIGLNEKFEADVFESIAGEILQAILKEERFDLLLGYNEKLKRCNGSEELKRQAEGQIVFQTNRKKSEIKCLLSGLQVASTSKKDLGRLQKTIAEIEKPLTNLQLKRLLSTELSEEETVQSLVQKTELILRGD